MTEPEGERPGLYLHLPFCSAICPYCDFAVLVGSEKRKARFVDALEIEIERLAATGLPAAYGPGFDTIYLGGGTPSALATNDLARLLETLRRRLPILEGARLFLEVNPEDVKPDAIESWRRLGVSMLSLGVQSFRDPELSFLGRRHDAKEARRAVELAREAGFETLSIDLIYGLPNQTPEQWRVSLDIALQLEPDHLSCYELEIHRRTTFGKKRQRGELMELSDDAQAELFLFTHRRLAEAGFPGYEISNFARHPRHHSSHNRKHWHHVPYLGLGPSAHSFDGARRFWNERHFETWYRRLMEGEMPRHSEEVLSPEDLALETVMLALRTADGLDLARFGQRFGFDLLERNRTRLQSWSEEGYLQFEEGRLVPTFRGWAIADALAIELDLA